MSDNKCQPSCRETVCIDTYRVLDSCRDKDCFENVRVYLTGFGQELVERGTPVRAKCAKVIWAFIDTDPVPFNRGFYQLTIKMFVKITAEACVAPGNLQELDGIAVVEKKVILFGSEGNVSVFKSDSNVSAFCPSFDGKGCSVSSNLPVAVLEVVDPIVLSSKVLSPHICHCCCPCCDVPEGVAKSVNGGDIVEGEGNTLAVSLGFFSVVRIERPAQYLIHATEYSVPEKECVEAKEDDPCHLFRSMAFPVNEFYPPSVCAMEKCRDMPQSPSKCSCGCQDKKPE